MKQRIQSILLIACALCLPLKAQDDNTIVIKLIGGDKPTTIAVPDFRGSGDAAQHMSAFNETLFSDLEESGLFKMVAKGFLPPETPQRPEDFRQGTNKRGLWLSDWSSPPTAATHLAFGYTAVQGDQIALLGWLYDVSQQNVQSAQLLAKRYFGPVTQDGARKVAHEFAADIIRQFGGEPLLGSRIYFISDRTGKKEIWSMDPDGSNQKAFTNYHSISVTPAVSPDGTKIAFTTYARGNPDIFVHSLETGRRLPFFNQRASFNGTPAFTPDGGKMLYASTVSGYAQIYIANADGSGAQRLTNTRSVEVEPKVNPKGRTVVMVSGRSGPPQIYLMELDGSNPERLTSGEGDATNPSWHPNGEVIAFSWTRGFEPGKFNLFVMDVASRKYNQLTHNEGRNENPYWAPDGRHLVFASTRSGTPQIWTMLADGKQLKRLTSQGRNTMPVWAK